MSEGKSLRDVLVEMSSLVDYDGISWETAAAMVIPCPKLGERIAAAGRRLASRGCWPRPYDEMLNSPMKWPEDRA